MIMRPLLGADGETVQSVDGRIAPGFFLGITRRKEHEHVAIDRVSFQIAFQSRPVNLDMFDRHWFRTSNERRHIGLQLGCELRS